MAKTIRYFAGVLKDRIWFRASPTMAYKGLRVTNGYTPIFTQGAAFDAPLSQITKAAYDALTEIKLERLREDQKKLLDKGWDLNTSPSHSWVASTIKNDGIFAKGVLAKAGAARPTSNQKEG